MIKGASPRQVPCQGHDEEGVGGGGERYLFSQAKPSSARSLTLRSPQLVRRKQEDIEWFEGMVEDKAVQRGIGEYLAALSSKKK